MPLQISKRQKGNMKQLTLLKKKLTHIRRHRAKFGLHSDLASGIGAPRIIITFFYIMKTNYSISEVQIMQTLNS